MSKKKRRTKRRHPQIPEITIGKLVKYNLLFFIPLLAIVLISFYFAPRLARYLGVGVGTSALILIDFLSVGIFFFIIPYIRRKEKIAGIRYSIMAFFIIGLGLTVPSAIRGNYTLFMNLPILIGHYLFLTFIFSPEVLGIAKDIKKWFLHHRQFIIMLVYLAIVLMYVFGFANLQHRVHEDRQVPIAFEMSNDASPRFGTFLYYSLVTFSTVGYGDIVPVSTAARLVFGLEAISGMVINVIFIAILIMFISGVRSEEEELEEIEKLEREVQREEGVLGKLFGR